jgi:hypothetical protein
MGTAMNVGVIAGVVVLESVEHLAGLLAGGRVIEIDQRPAVGRSLRQNWKI